MSKAARPETMGFREFASLAGFKPGYVTELKSKGRLVLTPDGKRVRVAESLTLIDDTRDPARIGVAARHAAAREQGGAVVAPAGPGGESAADSGGDDAQSTLADPVADSHARRRAKALADKEEALARKAQRDEQLELGQLLRVDDVIGALTDAATTLRTSLESLPAALAPELAAATSEDRIRVLLGDALESRLTEMARKFGAIGRAEA